MIFCVKITIRISKGFTSQAKPLLKKFKSLSSDLLNLQKELLINPRLGISLGADVYKIRLKISSKGKGKSGGARVISFLQSEIIFVEEFVSEEEIIINLISIYDKSEISTFSEKELKELIKALKKELE
jgi:mRNA-degrading endonuclease RelE of RelBE toxin-antitoxin system